MTFKVELNMFQEGAIRKVRVPTKELTLNTQHNLQKIFYWGQNDFQPVSGRCSVSAGDTIRYFGLRYLILPIGFRKLKKGEKLSHDPITRIKELYAPDND